MRSCSARLAVGATLGFCLAVAGFCWAQTPEPVQVFQNPAPNPYEAFSWSVAGSGDRQLIGVPYNNSASGSVYLFDSASAELVRFYHNPAPNDDDHFGWSVAFVGENILVGAPSNDTVAGNAGSAYLFHTSTGTVRLTLDNPDPGSGDLFGWSVALTGTTALVGAPFSDLVADNGGAVYVFDIGSGDLLATWTNPVPQPGELFGWALSEAGNRLLVGAPGNSEAEPGAGAAYILDMGSGALLQALGNPSPAVGDNFGWSVALSAAQALVGAPFAEAGAQNVGAAHLFAASTGAHLLSFSNPTPNAGDTFGWAVAFQGSQAVVGAPKDDTSAPNAGAAYMFSASSGALVDTFHDPNSDLNECFGWALSEAGGNVLVGVPFGDTRSEGVPQFGHTQGGTTAPLFAVLNLSLPANPLTQSGAVGPVFSVANQSIPPNPLTMNASVGPIFSVLIQTLP